MLKSFIRPTTVITSRAVSHIFLFQGAVEKRAIETEARAKSYDIRAICTKMMIKTSWMFEVDVEVTDARGFWFLFQHVLDHV
jgi:hypothetical protein